MTRMGITLVHYRRALPQRSRFPRQPHPVNPGSGLSCYVPWLDGEVRVGKGSGASARSSRHRELNRTMKIAAGTVQGPSTVKKSTGLVWGQGQGRRELLRPCPPSPYALLHGLGKQSQAHFPHRDMEALHPFAPQVSVWCFLCTKLWALWQSDLETSSLLPLTTHTHTHIHAGTSLSTAPSTHPGRSRKQLPPH